MSAETLYAICCVFTLVHVAFLIALLLKRNDFADVIWSLAYIAASGGVLLARQSPGSIQEMHSQHYIVFALICFWGSRLSLHIFKRFLYKKEEDFRYKEMRQSWGSLWLIKTYAFVFLLQGFLALVIVSPVIVFLQNEPMTPLWLFYPGFGVWLIGFIIESVSDHQLSAFKKSNSGKLMTTGLWKWSQYPNYFGETAQWWGVFLMCLTSVSSLPLILSPITITFLLLKVSGVPLLRERLKGRPGYQEYSQKTSLFIPWPPKK